MRNVYNDIIEAKIAKNEGRLKTALIKWIADAENNPFKVNDPAYELFFQAKLYFRKWQNDGIDSRRAKVLMMSYLTRIVDMNLPNPYPESEETIEDSKTEETKPIHVLGVLSDKKNKELKIEAENNEEPDKDLLKTEKQTEEKAEHNHEKIPFFSKKKK